MNKHNYLCVYISGGLMKETDEILLERFCNGERPAMQTLVERYQVALYNYLVRFVNDTHLAEDIFQDTFVKVAIKAKDFDCSKSFRPWLYTVASNIARDSLRRRKIRTHQSIEKETASGVSMRNLLEDKTVANAHAVCEQRETLNKIHKCIDTFSEDLQHVIHLHFFQGLKYREVAETLDIPLGTVKSRLSTAVGRLQEKLNARKAGHND